MRERTHIFRGGSLRIRVLGECGLGLSSILPAVIMIIMSGGPRSPREWSRPHRDDSESTSSFNRPLLTFERRVAHANPPTRVMHDLDLILTLTGGLAAALACGYVELPARVVAHRRIPARRVPRRAEHARLRRQPAAGRPVRRGRRHPPDVRRRPAVPPRRSCWPSGGWPCPAPSVRASSSTLLGHPGRGRLRVGLVGRARLRPGPLRGEHRRAHAGPRGNGDLHTPAGHIAVGWLVVEDLFTVLVLVLLPAVFSPAGAGAAGVVRRGGAGAW